MVSGDLSVGAGSAITPGETLYVAVGGTPTESNGGFNGGGNGNANGRSGGGGGASDVRTCSRTSTSCANGVTSLLARLIVAAGSGGAGGCVFVQRVLFCGAGGSAGHPAAPQGRRESRSRAAAPGRSWLPAREGESPTMVPRRVTLEASMAQAGRADPRWRPDNLVPVAAAGAGATSEAEADPPAS